MTDAIDLVEIVHEYFRRADAGSSTLLDLFAEDAQIYFPKYGIGNGRAGLLELMAGLGKFMASSHHPSENFLFIRDGNRIVAEGATSGRLVDGTSWNAGTTPAGRFCNVFEFRGGLISRLHVYLDPDYAGRDESNFHWGRENRSW